MVQGLSAPGFGPGAEVTHWSGIPVDRAVDLNAARFAGSNAAARHSRGVQSLTVRPLVIHQPPDEEWVTISYVGTDGAEHELRQPWLVTENLPPLNFQGEGGPQGFSVELLRLMAAGAGLALQLQVLPWQRAMPSRRSTTCASSSKPED